MDEKRTGDDGGQWTYLDPILQFDLATSVDGDVLESLSRTIVRFAAALKGLQHGSLVNTPRDVGVESAGAARTSFMAPDPRVKADGTHLKRLMRSNISSWETSGYFFCRRMACIVKKRKRRRDQVIVWQG